MVKNEDTIFKKTGLRHIIVNCQLPIVNSAKPFKHQFVSLLHEIGKRMEVSAGDTAIADGMRAGLLRGGGMGYMYKMTGIELYRITKN